MSRPPSRKPRVRPGQILKLGGTHGPALLKALAAKDRTSLRGAERNRRFLAALRAAGLRFRPNRRGTSADGFSSFGLTGFAAFGFVLEAFVGEKHLFAGSEHKFGTALRAFQNLVVVFHGSVPPWTPNGGNAQTLHEGPRKNRRNQRVQDTLF